jgi:hypothetical protein
MDQLLLLTEKKVSSTYCREQSWWDTLVSNVNTLDEYHRCVQLIPNREDTVLVFETFSRDIALQHPDIAKKVMSIVRVRCLLLWEPPYIFLHPELWDSDWLRPYLTWPCWVTQQHYPKQAMIVKENQPISSHRSNQRSTNHDRAREQQQDASAIAVTGGSTSRSHETTSRLSPWTNDSWAPYL